jgi:ribosomal protein S4
MRFALKASSRQLDVVEESLESRTRPSSWSGWPWIRRTGWRRMVRKPTREDIPLDAQEQLIVELYSK